MVSWMRGAPTARDCWEGHRPHAIPTALTAHLLRQACCRWTRHASCACRWAGGWAKATTWRRVEWRSNSNNCGGAVARRRRESEREVVAAQSSRSDRRRWVITSRQAGGMEACSCLPDRKGACGDVCVALRCTGERHGRSWAQQYRGAVPATGGCDWRRWAGCGGQPTDNGTSTTPVLVPAANPSLGSVSAPRQLRKYHSTACHIHILDILPPGHVPPIPPPPSPPCRPTRRSCSCSPTTSSCRC